MAGGVDQLTTVMRLIVEGRWVLFRYYGPVKMYTSLGCNVRAPKKKEKGEAGRGRSSSVLGGKSQREILVVVEHTNTSVNIAPKMVGKSHERMLILLPL